VSPPALSQAGVGGVGPVEPRPSEQVAPGLPVAVPGAGRGRVGRVPRPVGGGEGAAGGGEGAAGAGEGDRGRDQERGEERRERPSHLRPFPDLGLAGALLIFTRRTAVVRLPARSTIMPLIV